MNDQPVNINTPQWTRIMMIDKKGMIRSGYLHSIIPDPVYTKETLSLEECVKKGIPLLIKLSYFKNTAVIVAEGYIENTVVMEDCEEKG